MLNDGTIDAKTAWIHTNTANAGTQSQNDVTAGTFTLT